MLFAYGFDTPMKEYFFACFDLSKDDQESEESCVFAVSSTFTLKPHPAEPEKLSYSNSEIMTLMEEYPGVVDPEHMDAIALDIPF